MKYKRYIPWALCRQNNARNLIPYLPAWQNVQMPMLFSAEVNSLAGKERALELLDIVGLSHKRNSRLSELSGGEQQRVAIAIALANDPKILLADEPTGSVDPATANYIFETFKRLNRETGLTIVIVTHDLTVAEKVSRVVSIRDGKISSERIMKNEYANRIAQISTFDTSGEERFTTHDEFAILDRNGRVQIPSEFLSKVGIDGNKVKLEVRGNEIVISPPEK